MRARTWAAAAALLMAAATAEAQTTHPGKVIIRSTAADALTVLGGASVGGSITVNGAGGSVISSVNPIAYFIETDAPANQKRWRQITDGSTFYLQAETDGGAPASVFYVQRSGGTPTQFVFGMAGSAALPALSFTGDQDSGFYHDGSFPTYTNSGFATYQLALDDFRVLSRAMGTGNVGGPAVTIGYNTSGGGAPGVLNVRTKIGGSAYLWMDSTGVYRGGAAQPTEISGDTIGTVIGTQTSTAASKHLGGRVNDLAPAAMAIVRDTPIYRFTYKNGAYNGETFYGITTDDSPLFGMDGGKSFNPVTAFGVSVLALQDLDARVRALENKR